MSDLATLHIAPGLSAGGSLRQAIRDASRRDEVLPFCDDLSCGPVGSDSASARTAWWDTLYPDGLIAAGVGAFWNRIATTDDRLVVWFGRHSASELAFFLALIDRLDERLCQVIDVTGLRLPFELPDGSARLTAPAQAVGIAPPDALRSLLGSERELSAQEREEARRRWRQLKAEDAPFRVVSLDGLVSAPIDHFDPLLMERATIEWRKAARIVGEVMAHNFESYLQVGDLMLLTRIVALVDQGRLQADGDPWDMPTCRLRLPAAK